jgi:formylglycine-generating enzyme required for sulfatase activity
LLAGFLTVAALTAPVVFALSRPEHKAKALKVREKVRPEPVSDKSGGVSESSAELKLIPIKGGRFMMGNAFNEGDSDEVPLHEVTIADFSLGTTAVTRGQFRLFVSATGFRTDAEKGEGCYVEKNDVWNYDPATSWRNPGFFQDDSHPVVCVSWHDAASYAEWLSKKNGRRYRLPTEAEWEYAARSGGQQERFAGFSDPKQFSRYGNFCDRNCTAEWRTTDQDDRYKYTAPVASYLPNALGLYDMVGNVWQWTSDYYGERYYRESSKKWPLDTLYGGEQRREQARINPQGPAEGKYRTLRGGSWNSAPIDARSAQRLRNKPEYRRSYIGFRLAVSP